MNDKQDHDVYNHPISEQEAEKEQNTTGERTDHQVVSNPNPRANENIVQRNRNTDSTDAANQTGSEITDGEDG